jgi:Leucine-rich repeat (LRR) protein
MQIDLVGNRIKALLSPLTAPKLEYLHAAMNDIKKVQIPRISKLPNLKSVDLRGNLISVISDDVYFYCFYISYIYLLHISIVFLSITVFELPIFNDQLFGYSF